MIALKSKGLKFALGEGRRMVVTRAVRMHPRTYLRSSRAISKVTELNQDLYAGKRVLAKRVLAILLRARMRVIAACKGPASGRIAVEHLADHRADCIRPA